VSAFDDHFNQSGASQLHSYFGDTATYTPPTGSASTDDVTLCNAVFTDEQVERRYDDEGVRTVVTREVTLIVDSAHPQFCGLEAPLARGQIAYDGGTYVIVNPPASAGHGSEKLMLERHQAAAVTRPEYYRKG